MTDWPPLDRLRAIMARLRDPDRGCEWDRSQTWTTIAPYTIEEAYEVADAVARNDAADIRDELGDLLFQVVFQSRIASHSTCTMSRRRSTASIIAARISRIYALLGLTIRY